jgi:hypothetical protein
MVRTGLKGTPVLALRRAVRPSVVAIWTAAMPSSRHLTITRSVAVGIAGPERQGAALAVHAALARTQTLPVHSNRCHLPIAIQTNPYADLQVQNAR